MNWIVFILFFNELEPSWDNYRAANLKAPELNRRSIDRPWNWLLLLQLVSFLADLLLIRLCFLDIALSWKQLDRRFCGLHSAERVEVWRYRKVFGFDAFICFSKHWTTGAFLLFFIG